MKGITPVISVILLLLVVVTVVSISFLFFTDTVETSGEQATTSIENIANQSSQIIRLESASGTDILVRNLGAGTVTVNDSWSVIVNNVLVDCTWSESDAVSGQVSNCVLNNSDSCDKDEKVTVSSPGNSQTETCPFPS